ncbi:MAG TPA: hypothetical protein VGR25_10600 [bacterium]|nr:hypothetical protein [bacterium]
MWWPRPMALAALALAAALLAGPQPAISGFPGSNGKIAFVSDRNGNQEIYVMAADGTGQTNLTNNPAADFNPAWSPDGTRIAFASDRAGGNNWDIYVMAADGTGVTRLTTHVALDWNPAWSPDGTKILFTTYRYGGGELATMNPDGTGVTRLTTNTSYDRHPKWSPLGTKIAFESYRGGSWEIVSMNADGSGQIILASDPSYDFEPDWSPDGAKIAWRGGRDDGIGDIFVMNQDGTGVVNLTNDPAYDREPGWSPDGTKIVYATVQGGNFQIYTMTASGGSKTPLTTNSGNDYDPDWQVGSGSPTSFTLTIRLAGAGSGSVRSSPAGVRCPPDCAESYAAGTVVRLAARVRSGSSFGGWSGACTGTGGCVVTMNAAKTVTATFTSP